MSREIEPTRISSVPVSSARVSLPASLLSAVVHMLLLLVVALCVPAAVRSVEEPQDRDVGIVLVSRSAERPTYVQQPADETSSDEASTAPQSQATEAAAGQALPATAARSLMLPEIELPGELSGSLASDDLLVQDLSLGRGGSRPILPGQDDTAILAEEAARRAARRSLGPATQVSVFGSAPAQGRSFVFAIDRSKSMGGSGLNALVAARSELASALAHLTPSHRFQIIAYSHTANYYRSPRLVPASDENKAGIPAFFETLGAFGGTDHEMAVRAGLGMEPDVVFLMTDGGDPHLNEIQLKNLKKLAENLATVHCIQFGFGPLSDSDPFMARLARQTGGSYTYVDMANR